MLQGRIQTVHKRIFNTDLHKPLKISKTVQPPLSDPVTVQLGLGDFTVGQVIAEGDLILVTPSKNAPPAKTPSKKRKKPEGASPSAPSSTAKKAKKEKTVAPAKKEKKEKKEAPKKVKAAPAPAPVVSSDSDDSSSDDDTSSDDE